MKWNRGGTTELVACVSDGRYRYRWWAGLSGAEVEWLYDKWYEFQISGVSGMMWNAEVD